MAKIMQNLVFLMEQPDRASDSSRKGGMMCLNRFGIEEDDGFELSGVYNLNQIRHGSYIFEKGTGNLS